MEFNSLLFIFFTGRIYQLQAQDGYSLPWSSPASQKAASAKMTQRNIINKRANEEPIPIQGKLILETVNSF